MLLLTRPSSREMKPSGRRLPGADRGPLRLRRSGLRSCQDFGSQAGAGFEAEKCSFGRTWRHRPSE